MERKLKEIFGKVSIHSASQKEQQEMLSLFHQDDIEFKVKAELTDILDSTKVISDEDKELKPLFEKIWKIISEREKKPGKRLFLVNTLLKVAAVLLLGLVIGKLVITSFRNTEQYYYTSVAPKGSISQIILPDSSSIFLNAGSTIKYSMNGKKKNREVFLNGEAWFQVQKSDKKPFVVHTGFYDVNVKGTEFNVRAYKEDADVVTTLEKGSIVVTYGNIGLREQSILKPGEQLVYNKETESRVVRNVNTLWFTSWKENKLIFINMSFSDLVVLLERKYGVDIQVENREVLKYHYDGTIKNESIIEVLNLLKQTLQIDYCIKDQIIKIKRK